MLKSLFIISLSIVIYLLISFLVNYYSIYSIISALLICLIMLNFKLNTFYNYELEEPKHITLLTPVKNEEDCIGNSIKYLKKIDYPSDKFDVM